MSTDLISTDAALQSSRKPDFLKIPLFEAPQIITSKKKLNKILKYDFVPYG